MSINKKIIAASLIIAIESSLNIYSGTALANSKIKTEYTKKISNKTKENFDSKVTINDSCDEIFSCQNVCEATCKFKTNYSCNDEKNITPVFSNDTLIASSDDTITTIKNSKNKAVDREEDTSLGKSAGIGGSNVSPNTDVSLSETTKEKTSEKLETESKPEEKNIEDNKNFGDEKITKKLTKDVSTNEDKNLITEFPKNKTLEGIAFNISNINANEEVPSKKDDQSNNNLFEDISSFEDFLKIIGINRPENKLDESTSQNELSRIEFLKMLITALGHDKVAEKLRGPSKFSDVTENDPDVGYINSSISLGIIDESSHFFSGGLFNKDQSITMGEAVILTVKALGYGKEAGLEGGKSENFYFVANDIGVLKKIDFDAEKNLNYKDAAILIFNSLEIPIADYIDYGIHPEFRITNKTLLRNVHELEKIEGRLTAVEGLAVENKKALNTGELSLDDTIYFYDKKKINPNNKLGRNVIAYLKSSKNGPKYILYIILPEYANDDKQEEKNEDHSQKNGEQNNNVTGKNAKKENGENKGAEKNNVTSTPTDIQENEGRAVPDNNLELSKSSPSIQSKKSEGEQVESQPKTKENSNTNEPENKELIAENKADLPGKEQDSKNPEEPKKPNENQDKVEHNQKPNATSSVPDDKKTEEDKNNSDNDASIKNEFEPKASTEKEKNKNEPHEQEENKQGKDQIKKDEKKSLTPENTGSEPSALKENVDSNDTKNKKKTNKDKTNPPNENGTPKNLSKSKAKQPREENKNKESEKQKGPSISNDTDSFQRIPGSGIEILTNNIIDIKKLKNNEILINYQKSKNENSTKRALIENKDLQYFYNESDGGQLTVEKLRDINGLITLIDSQGNGKFDIVVAEDYKPFIVDKINFDGTATDKNNKTIRIVSTENVNVDIFKNQVQVNYSSIKEGDLLWYFTNEDSTNIKIYVENLDTVSGEIVEKFSNGDIRLDSGEILEKSDVENEKLNIGDQNKFYVSKSNKIMAHEKEINVKILEDNEYGYLLDASFFNEIEPRVQLKIFTKNGREEIYESEKTVKFNELDQISFKDLLDQELLKGNGGIKSQVIMYKLSQMGKISEIKTPTASDVPLQTGFNLDATVKNETYSKTSSKLGKFKITDKTLIIDVSDDSNGLSGYKILKKEDLHEGRYTASIYNVTRDIAATLIVIKDSNYIARDTDSLFIVGETSEFKDENGKITQKAYGFEDNKISELSAFDKSVFKKSDNKALKRGDAFVYSKDNEGNVRKIKLLFDITNKNTEYLNQSHPDVEIVYGFIQNIFDDSINVNVSGNVENFEIGAAPIYFYDTLKTKDQQMRIIDESMLKDYLSPEANSSPIRILLRIVKDKVSDVLIIAN